MLFGLYYAVPLYAAPNLRVISPAWYLDIISHRQSLCLALGSDALMMHVTEKPWLRRSSVFGQGSDPELVTR